LILLWYKGILQSGEHVLEVTAAVQQGFVAPHLNWYKRKLLWSSLEQAQLEVGLGMPFLDTPFGLYGFLLMDCLWATIWSFIPKHNISLSSPDQVLPKRQRQRDEFIMEKLVLLGTLTQSELISCNRCRLAMEAVTLADIVTGDGKRIRSDSIGAHSSTTHPSTWEFPVENPSTQDLDSWRKGLVILLSASFELPFTDILGPWIALPHRLWEWFYFPADGMLYPTPLMLGIATSPLPTTPPATALSHEAD